MRDTVVHGDCNKIIPNLHSKGIVFDGAITSPPYHLGEDPNHNGNGLYNNYDDNIGRSKWLQLLTKLFINLDMVIKPKGTICMVISYGSKDPILPYELAIMIHYYTPWTLREEIAWIKNSSTPLNTSPRNLSRRYEKIMIFAREGVDYNTNKKKGVITNGQQFYKKMDNVIFAKNKDTHNDAPYHSATYSKELVRQIMRIYYTRGSYIIDPFAGLGTTIHSALQNGMHGLGIDIDLDYVNYANSIIEDIKKQTSLDQYI